MNKARWVDILWPIHAPRFSYLDLIFLYVLWNANSWMVIVPTIIVWALYSFTIGKDIEDTYKGRK